MGLDDEDESRELTKRAMGGAAGAVKKTFEDAGDEDNAGGGRKGRGGVYGGNGLDRAGKVKNKKDRV